MPIPDNTYFGEKPEGGGISYGEVRKITDDQKKLIILKGRLDTILVGQINELSALNEKGILFSMLGEYDRAIKCYDKAIKLEPCYIAAWINRGNAMKDKGLYEEAVKCYDKALEIKLQNRCSQNDIQNTSIMTGKDTEACKYYNRNLLEKDPDRMYVTILYNKGLALSYDGKYKKSLECYDKILEINPMDFFTWLNKGVILARQGKTKKALDCFDKVLELHPDDIRALEHKGIILKILNRYKESLECFNKIINIDREHPYAEKEVKELLLAGMPVGDVVLPKVTPKALIQKSLAEYL